MDLAAIDTKLDEIKNLTDGVQKMHSDLDKREFDNHEGLQKAITEITGNMQEIQELRQKEAAEAAALKETVITLETKLSRAVKSANDDTIEQFSQYGDEFSRYLKKGIEPSQDLIEDVCRGICEKSFHGMTADEVNQEIKTMVAGANPRGGYWVRPEVSTRMIERVFETSPLRAVANVITISSDSIEISIDDNEAADGGWVGEVDTRNTTDTPDIGQLTILAHEIFAQPKVTQKFLDDAAIDVESWLQGKVTRKISRSENTAFITGDGSKKPRGLLDYPDAASFGTYERGAIQTKTATGTSGQLTEPNDLKLLQNGLKEEYQPGAIWGMKRQTFGDIIILQDSQGQYIFQSRFINERDSQMLLGKPVVFMDDMPAVATDALAVIYGDFNLGYTIVDRTGFRVLRDDLTEKPFIKFYTTKRTGGDVTSYDSWNRLKIN